MLIAILFGLHPFLTKLYADAGYQGPRFADAVEQAMGQLQVEIVKRSELHRFVVLPKRWLVEHTIGKPQPQCNRLPAPCLHPPHAQKTMQSSLN